MSEDRRDQTPASGLRIRGGGGRSLGHHRRDIRLFKHEVDDQKDHADRDRGIRDVECRPVVAVDIDIQKVDHLPETQPVDEIADRAAENRRHAQPPHPLPLRHAVENRPEQHQGENRREPEEHHPERVATPGQQPERRARIADVGKTEEVGNDRNGFVQPHRLHDVLLRQLIDHDHAARQRRQHQIPQS